MSKKNIRTITSILLGISLFAYGAWQAQQKPRKNVSGVDQFRVIKVIDGDTVEIDYYGQTTKLRLIGLDTPEVVDPRKPVQCFGREASAHAHELLDGKKIILESDPVAGETDKYSRKLAYIFLEDGKNFAEAMIRDGYGHEYTYQSQAYKYQTSFKAAEAEARSSSRGLWSPDTCSGDTKKSVLRNSSSG